MKIFVKISKINLKLNIQLVNIKIKTFKFVNKKKVKQIICVQILDNLFSIIWATFIVYRIYFLISITNFKLIF